MTALVMTITVAGGFVVWALTERAGHHPNGETFAEELTEQLVPAGAISAAGIVLAVVAARWLTQRATARVDTIIRHAGQISAHDLSLRLPVGTEGDELDELAQAFNLMLNRIANGIDAQRQFAADASHELRTPLTTAVVALEVARRRPRPVEELELVIDQTRDELGRMSTLIDAILQLSRAEHPLDNREAVLVRELLDRITAELSTRTTIGFAVDGRDDLWIEADTIAIEIAIGNILANAVSVSPAGGTVRVRVVQEGTEIRIDVIDRGPGVAPGDRARIFEPFTRGNVAHADRAAHGAGVGLGLAITQRIVRAHAGRVEVGEAPGGGAQFTLWLPASPLHHRGTT